MRRILIASLATMALAIALPGAAQAAVTLQPGAYHETDAGSCTLNFAYAGGGKTYLGTAAHCVASIGQSVRDLDGTDFGKVAFIGDQNVTQWDFAFIAVDPEDLGRVSAAVKGHPTSRRARPCPPTRSSATRSSSPATASATTPRRPRRRGARRSWASTTPSSTTSRARSTGATRADRSCTSGPARRSASSAALRGRVQRGGPDGPGHPRQGRRARLPGLADDGLNPKAAHAIAPEVGQ